jgi:hypothetical protein
MKSRSGITVLWLVLMARGAFSQETSPPTLRDGIPIYLPRTYVEIVNLYDSSDVPKLLEILDSERDMEYWVRAAGLIGVIGDDTVVDELIDLVERPFIGPVTISQTQHRMRAEAIRALGFLVSRTGNAQALEYLIDSLDDSIWRQRDVPDVVPYLPSSTEYDRQLSIYAIFGLALSGHPQAGEALRSLQLAPTSEQLQLRSGLDDILDTWLEVHDVVAERGVAGMYEYYESQRLIRARREVEEARESRAGPGPR